MAKYFQIIGVAFSMLFLSIVLGFVMPTSTLSEIICRVVFYVTPIVLLVLLLRHTPNWAKWTVLGICVVMPFYVYFFKELRLHLKYHIWISSVGYPADWEPDMQKKWIEEYLSSVFTDVTFYSMVFLVGFKLARRSLKIEKLRQLIVVQEKK